MVHYTTVYKKYRLWIKNDIFERAFNWELTSLNQRNRISGLNYIAIDCSLIKSIRGVDSIGRNPCDRGRNGSKISLVVTETCIPLAIALSGANTHDSKLAIETLDKVPIGINSSCLLADKAYSSEPLKRVLKHRNLALIYPFKKNQKPTPCEFKIKNKLLKKRNCVERVFGWLKSYRKLIVRNEYSIKSFKQFIYMALLQILKQRTS